MKISRRSLLMLGAAAAATRQAAAQPASSNPIRLIVPFAAGGAIDIAGRLMAQALFAELGTAVVVENRPGAGGLIALDLVAKSAPDGLTLAVGGAGPLTISPSLYKTRGFDPLARLSPVIWFASTPGVLVVRPDLPAQDVNSLLALSKSAPSRLNMSSAGTGSINHLMGEYFQNVADVKWTHIPYKGSSPALIDLMAGRVDVMMDIVPTAAPYVKSDKLRALAVTTMRRSQQLPDVPTLDELGFTGFNVSSWMSLLAPSGMPRDLALRYNQALNAALGGVELRERLASIGADPEGGPPERVFDQARIEIPRWAAIIAATGATAE